MLALRSPTKNMPTINIEPPPLGQFDHAEFARLCAEDGRIKMWEKNKAAWKEKDRERMKALYEKVAKWKKATPALQTAVTVAQRNLREHIYRQQYLTRRIKPRKTPEHFNYRIEHRKEQIRRELLLREVLKVKSAFRSKWHDKHLITAFNAEQMDKAQPKIDKENA